MDQNNIYISSREKLGTSIVAVEEALGDRDEEEPLSVVTSSLATKVEAVMVGDEGLSSLEVHYFFWRLTKIKAFNNCQFFLKKQSF